MAGQDGARIAQLIHDAYNSRDFAKPEELIAEGFAWTFVAFGATFTGVAGYREAMQAWATGFPDSQVDTTSLIDGGDYGVIQFMFRGTQTGPFRGPAGEIPPTGRSIEIPACNIWRTQNGKLIEAHTYFDAATLMRQLGLMS